MNRCISPSGLHCLHWRRGEESCCWCEAPLPEDSTPVERLTMYQMLQRETKERLGMLRRLARRMLRAAAK